MKKNVIVGVSLLAIIGLASFFRFYDLQNYPPGLFPDQAANGEDALLILEGDMRPFYERGNGREALFFYLQAWLIAGFGVGVWPMFAASALVGVATVGLTYFATRPWFGKTAGLMAALLLATNHWHVTLSRTGFRAILLPLMVVGFTAAAGYAILAVKDGRLKKAYLLAAAAGVFFAGGFYTYIAYRVMIGVVLGMATIWLLASLHPKIGWPQVKKYWRQLVWGIVAAGVTLAPLAWYFVDKPEAIVGRAGQVSVFNPDLQKEGGLWPTITWSLTETVLAFFSGEGDLNWRHNVAGYPLLNPLVGFLLLLGLLWSLKGVWEVGRKILRGEELHLDLVYPYLWLLLLGMLLPVVTTAEGIPHGLRALGLLPPIFILAGTAGAVIINWARRQRALVQGMVLGLLAGGLVLGIGYDGLLYFVVARNASEAAAAYRADLSVVAQWLKDYRHQSPTMSRPYLVLDAFSVQTVHFLTTVAAHDYQEHPDEAQHLYTLVEPATSHEQRLQPGEVIIFTASTLPDADRYEENWQNIEQIDARRSRWGDEWLRVYRAKAGGGQPQQEEMPSALDA
jgi:hypothetical protein